MSFAASLTGPVPGRREAGGGAGPPGAGPPGEGQPVPGVSRCPRLPVAEQAERVGQGPAQASGQLPHGRPGGRDGLPERLVVQLPEILVGHRERAEPHPRRDQGPGLAFVQEPPVLARHVGMWPPSQPGHR
jgi:hypothetical protein